MSAPASLQAMTARDVTVRAGGRSLIEAISLETLPGEILAVIGANGAGKSTLLRALAGEIKPSAGAVLLDGQPLAAISPAVLARRRAVLPQETRLAFSLTVEQVVGLGRLPHRATSDRHGDALATARAIAAVEMSGFAERHYMTLSGGERQRVNLARVLAQLDGAGEEDCGARYLLLDEPTAALDLKHQSALMSLLRQQADAGIGILAVLHDLNQAMAADRVAVLRGGSLLACGRPQDVLTPETILAAFDVAAQHITLPDGRRFLATA
jgi:iron complex transport system ATP-binding protein